MYIFNFTISISFFQLDKIIYNVYELNNNYDIYIYILITNFIFAIYEFNLI